MKIKAVKVFKELRGNDKLFVVFWEKGCQQGGRSEVEIYNAMQQRIASIQSDGLLNKERRG